MIEQGKKVRHEGDGREGVVIGSLVATIGEGVTTQILVEYTDALGGTSQAWFLEDDCRVVAD